ncbi:MAG: nuclear transport factor 2 family protein [Alphaproteobacteria bacterium]|nr:nuclear transport factor 2 family protein [Alphaproteobacteria bacterium]MCB9928401.1 nuclear transport factor 2 family protein [Alphaproteobacteria bacterium]
MSFIDLLNRFTDAVEAGDGQALARLFTDDGIYHDTFYGAFQGRDAIADMLENHFWRDARAFRWDMREPVIQGEIGYAHWLFSYESKLATAEGKRVAFEGMSCFHLRGDLIQHYGEVFDQGIALAQTGFAADRIAKRLAREADGVRKRAAGTRHLA